MSTAVVSGGDLNPHSTLMLVLNFSKPLFFINDGLIAKVLPLLAMNLFWGKTVILSLVILLTARVNENWSRN